MKRSSFEPIVSLIQSARSKALQSVNTALISLYWQIGQYISHRVAAEEWGKGVVTELAAYISRTIPSAKGFSDKNLWRMKQFYETYKDSELLAAERRQLIGVTKLTAPGRDLKKKKITSSPVPQNDLENIENTILAQLTWTHHRTIFGRCKSEVERVFYVNLAVKERYSVRDLERQISASLFERIALSKTKLSSPVRELTKERFSGIRDSYIFEFLNLPEQHNESDLQKAILQNLKKFLLEFSRDFAFIGEEFPVQVGNKDFALDLLFFNRALNCLVAIELKVVDFLPEHLGKMSFYLEALDRDVKKEHEDPSIGILLCKAKDDEVVEYAMSRQLSPAMVAQYQLQLPDKKLLQAKLQEFFETNKTKND